jgi:phage-related protein (TIGR01555 family)
VTEDIKEDGITVWTEKSLDGAGDSIVQYRRSDGWMNVVTGLGVAARDKRLSAEWHASPNLTHAKELLESMYHGNDLVNTFVSLPAEEMTREWIEVKVQNEEGSTADAEASSGVHQKLDELGVQTAVQTALTWGSLYGGSVLLLGVTDGGNPQEPLDVEKIDSFDWVTVLDRFDVYVEEKYDNPLEPKYGEPKLYRIMTGDQSILIHESRTIRFDGAPVSRQRRQENNGWADSRVNKVFEVIRDFTSASEGVAHILTDFSQAVFKINGLANLLAQDSDGLVLKRLQMLDLGRSIVRAIPLDAENEEFTRQGAAVTGMSDLYDRLMMRVSAATRMPVTLLFGRSPAGMNATGESDIRQFYDHIAASQESVLRPRLEYLISIILNASDGPTAGSEPDNWGFEFNPLYQESSKDKAETRKMIAQADQIYVNAGVVTAKEIAMSRFGGDGFSPETKLDPEERKRLEEMGEMAMAGLAAAQRNQSFEEQPGPNGARPTSDPADDGSRTNADSAAPNYRVQHADAADKLCASCVFASGSICTRYDSITDAGHVCDDWVLRLAADRHVTQLATKVGVKRKRRRGLRGRNM